MITRRDFLKLSGAAAATSLLAGYGSIERTSSQPIDTPKPEIVQFYPDVPSKVVHTHHAGVWADIPQGGIEANDLLVPEALREMLDASIVALTGLGSAADAWATLFAPDERAAIKVNAIQGDVRHWTHVPLVEAVIESLLWVGMPAEQIVVFDRDSYELKRAGYPDAFESGVRCRGSDGGYWFDEVWTIRDKTQAFSEILYGSDVLINMPILKAHPETGITFAMKNHFGTINLARSLHQNDVEIERSVAELCALPPIKDRTRLIIGDALSIADDPTSWETGIPGDSIFMSFDPVAHDAVGLQLLLERMTAEGRDTRATEEIATRCLKHAVELGLGTNDLANIDLTEVNLE
jgi:uncharacterized protein (DUF362 family)